MTGNPNVRLAPVVREDGGDFVMWVRRHGGRNLLHQVFEIEPLNGAPRAAWRTLCGIGPLVEGPPSDPEATAHFPEGLDDNGRVVYVYDGRGWCRRCQELIATDPRLDARLEGSQ